VRRQLAEEVDHRRLPEREDLVGELPGEVRAEPFAADLAAATPAAGLVDADVQRHDPMRLVPEDQVGSGFERCVRPLLQEGAIARVVEAGRPDAPSVVEHLARVEVPHHEAALGLAAERPPGSPGVHLHLEPERVRGGDDARHGVAVVGEIVLREGVQHAGEAAAGEVLEVSLGVPRDADAEVGRPRPSERGRHRGPSAPESPSAASEA
jgi:hypothetical protein